MRAVLALVGTYPRGIKKKHRKGVIWGPEGDGEKA
jgi:hypothetical protein